MLRARRVMPALLALPLLAYLATPSPAQIVRPAVPPSTALPTLRPDTRIGLVAALTPAISAANVARLGVRWKVPIFDAAKDNVQSNYDDLAVDTVTHTVILPTNAKDRDYGTSISRIRSFNLADGTVRWEQKQTFAAGTTGYFYARPVVIGNSVYVGNYYSLQSLDTQTGTKRWERSFAAPASGGTFGIPTAYGDQLYFTTGYLHSVDKASGASLWQVSAGRSAPVFDSTTIYINSQTKLAAVDPANRTSPRWVIAPLGGYSDWPPVVQGGFVYAQDRTSVLTAINASTGLIAWKVQEAVLDFESGMAFADGKLFVHYRANVAGGPYFLGAFSASDGHLIWSAPTAGQPVGSTPIVVNDVVFSVAKGLLAFSTATGAQLASFDPSPSTTKKLLCAVATPGGDGILATHWDGNLYMFVAQ
jgi:outer membrane protein assembly factor BamB